MRRFFYSAHEIIETKPSIFTTVVTMSCCMISYFCVKLKMNIELEARPSPEPSYYSCRLAAPAFFLPNASFPIECPRKGWCCCILYKFSWVIHHFRSHFNFSAPNRKSQTKRSPYERMFFQPWRKFHPPVEHTEFVTYHMVEVFWGALVGISPSTPPVNSLASVHEYFVLLLWAVGCLIYVVFSM